MFLPNFREQITIIGLRLCMKVLGVPKDFKKNQRYMVILDSQATEKP